jgi:hypothetical protein
MTPLPPIFTPESRDLMISIKVFGKTYSGAKNSRIGNTLSGKKFENVFEHLGVVATPLRCLQMIL